ncbi:hypothetical protein NI447_04285 [Enterococcus lactis]|nr:hypothetical protein [Enterococcus lactis]
MVGNKIKEKQLNVRFNIVGDGRYKQELMDEVEHASLRKWFHFVDPVPATEIPEILAGSDFSFVSLQKTTYFQ